MRSIILFCYIKTVLILIYSNYSSQQYEQERSPFYCRLKYFIPLLQSPFIHSFRQDRHTYFGFGLGETEIILHYIFLHSILSPFSSHDIISKNKRKKLDFRISPLRSSPHSYMY